MTLEVLISTIGDGILRVPEMLLAKRDDVKYLVSWQVDDNVMMMNVSMLSCWKRDDVRLFTMRGRGLSRNRNNTLLRAEGDILLISDDDCRYTNDYFDSILKTYICREKVDGNCPDIILFKANYNKAYPSKAMAYNKAMQVKGYYPASWEITMRRETTSELHFNEDFGLGSGKYICGEESIFLKDAEKANKTILFVPETVVDTPKGTTGERFLTDPEVQKAKGAVFRYCYSEFEAWWRCVKESLHYYVYNHQDPRPIYRNLVGKGK